MLTTTSCSGTTCDTTTNRTAPSSTAADPSYTPAICEHGHDTTDPAFGSGWWLQSSSAADAKHYSPTRIPVSQSDAAATTTAAADECSDGCPYTTLITSP